MVIDSQLAQPVGCATENDDKRGTDCGSGRRLRVKSEGDSEGRAPPVKPEGGREWW